MFSYGLKLWTVNDNYIDAAIKLFNKKIYSYIELYVIPDSVNIYKGLWTELKEKYEIDFILHAPHYREGLNLSKKDFFEKNIKLAEETLKFADLLGCEIVIFHPGINGSEEETVRQLNIINDKRIVIENKPYYSLIDNLICNGYSPEKIKYITKNTKTGFCLDIGHAICASNALKKEKYNFINEFIKLKPKLFHLSDGDINSVYDRHDGIGKGNYDFKKILKLIPAASKVTIEVNKGYKDKLDDFEEDIIKLKEICKRF